MKLLPFLRKSFEIYECYTACGSSAKLAWVSERFGCERRQGIDVQRTFVLRHDRIRIHLRVIRRMEIVTGREIRREVGKRRVGYRRKARARDGAVRIGGSGDLAATLARGVLWWRTSEVVLGLEAYDKNRHRGHVCAVMMLSARSASLNNAMQMCL
mgnify:CR=1 FL=1|jgi:hypothetical protein